MILSLLLRFWKPLAGLTAAIALLWWAHHAVYQQGYAKAQAEYAVAAKAAQVAADKATLGFKDKADKAQKDYTDANTALQVYMASHTLTGSQLCHSSGAGSHLPKASAGNGGNGGSSTPETVVRDVPTTDHRFAGDRLDLLKALGALAQSRNDSLAEWQAR